MKIDKITINDGLIDFETCTAKESPDDEPLKYLIIKLMGKKLPKKILQAFNNNDLMDIEYFIEGQGFKGDFICNSYSTYLPLSNYELELISNGAIIMSNEP